MGLSTDPEYNPAISRYLDLKDELESADEIRQRVIEEFPEFESELRRFWASESVFQRDDFDPDEWVAEKYRVRKKLGEGGFGSVWLAEQQSPVRRQVAIKVVKRGMDSRSILRRFDAERQTLALMEHDGIAKFYDSGTLSDGRSYFVLEYVPGKEVMAFCDDQRMGIVSRLRLFRRICQAVQHAHQKGIIHRDLKPSNVLVYQDGENTVVKVIDFGLAKAMTDRTVEASIQTHTGQVLGTFSYMSPEQVELSPMMVDTRADVFGLGAILFELLSGTPPLEPEKLKNRSDHEVLRLIAEAEFGKPSSRIIDSKRGTIEIAHARSSSQQRLAQALRGELDTIVIKALHKDRNHRYESAGEFGEDVQRYLDGRPIAARSPTITYRFQKWMQRHRALATVYAVLVVSMISIVAAVSYGLVVSRSALSEAKTAQANEAAQAKLAGEEARKAKRLQQNETRMLRRSEIRRYAQILLTAMRYIDLSDNAQARKLIESAKEIRTGLELTLSQALAAEGLSFEEHVDTNEICTAITVGPRRLFRTPRQKVVAVGTDAGTVWVKKGILLNRRKIQKWTSTNGRITSVALSDTGRFLAIGNSNGRVSVTDLDGSPGNIVASFQMPGGIVAVDLQAFLDDGTGQIPETSALAAADSLGNVDVWKPMSKERILAVKVNSKNISAISVGGILEGTVLAVGTTAGTIHFWSSFSNKSLQTKKLAHHGAVLDLEVNDVRGVTSCGEDGNRIEWRESRFKILEPELNQQFLRRSGSPLIQLGQVGIHTPKVIWIGIDPGNFRRREGFLFSCFIENGENGLVETVLPNLDAELDNGRTVVADITGVGDFCAVGIGNRIVMKSRSSLLFTKENPKDVMPNIPGLQLDFGSSAQSEVFTNSNKHPLNYGSKIRLLSKGKSTRRVAACLADGSLVVSHCLTFNSQWKHLKVPVDGIDGKSSVTSLGFSEDDRFIIYSRERTLYVHDRESGQLVWKKEFPEKINSFSSTSDNRLAVAAGRSVFTGSRSDDEWNWTESKTPFLVKTIAIHPSKKQFAALYFNGGIWFRDDTTEIEHRFSPSQASALVFDPESDRLIAVGRSLTVWELEFGEKLWERELPVGERPPSQIRLLNYGDSFTTVRMLIGIWSTRNSWTVQMWRPN